MKKLFKEVWKSFSKSKIILAGLIILIFLTSGIITLIFDVVNSYKTQYNTYKSKSILQDVTMNSDLDLYGVAPTPFYLTSKDDGEKETKITYSNTDNLLDNQWEYVYSSNINGKIDSIYINTDSEYYNLKNVIPTLASDTYVKTKELSYILNTNLNIGALNQYDLSGNTSVQISLTNSNSNQIQTYLKEGNDYIYDEITQISDLLDTYSSTTKTWTASLNAKNLFANNNFSAIVIDNDTQKAYVENSLKKATTSDEYKKYKSNPTSFTTINSRDVADMLGFKKNALNQWILDTSKTWILDGNIQDQKNKTTANNFFKQTSIPSIKNPFNLTNPISIPGKIDLNSQKLTIPTSWLVYSKTKYVYTENEKKLNGILENGDIDKNQWTGYYYEYLNYLKNNDLDKFNELTTIHYWTKKVYVTSIDKQGNEIFLTDENGNNTNKTINSEFNVGLTREDLTLNLTNNKGESSNLLTITGNLDNDATVEKLNTDTSSINENFITNEAKSFKYQQIYKKLQEITGKMGLRQTLTVNSNDENGTNVYQFINLGNSNNEINWNGINIKQEVGKLIDTDVNTSSIFNLPSNIDATSKQVPINYVPAIVDQLLTGLSPNRDYLNPMISFNNFTYTDENGNDATASSTKTIWLTKNGAKDLHNIYGITVIRDRNEGTKVYYVLQKDLTTDPLGWTTMEQYKSGIKTLNELSNFIISNNLNFAPFDLYGNDMQVVSNKGWARRDNDYADKYSVPFEYLLPNSDMIKDFNDAVNNPDGGKYGMERFRDNLIYSLTIAISPLISARNWDVLMNAVNTSFANNGFGAGLTPPAALTMASMIKVVVGVFRDAVVSTNQYFMGPLFANMLDGIKRSIDPDFAATVEQQKELLKIQLRNFSQILALTSGTSISLDGIVDLVSNPAGFLDGLKSLLSSINLDQSLIDIWNDFYVDNTLSDSKKILGVGDLVPYIYKNIYDTNVFLDSIKKISASTVIGDKLNSVFGLIDMMSPDEGFKYLESKTQTITNDQGFTSKTISLVDILNVFKIKIMGSLGNLLQSSGVQLPSTEINYDPTNLLYLELDMDLLWYLKNFVFVSSTTSSKTRSTEKDPMLLFGVDPNYFLQNATSAFTEIREDYNQITMTENAGKIAIVNQAFLEKNNKKVYKSDTLATDLNDLSKIDDQYKINVAGVEYVIVGQDFTVDYMYPVINSENITVNTEKQALVYVNQYGYDRAKRSNTAAPQESYFLFTTAPNESPKQLQTKLNELTYLWTTGDTYSSNIDINSNDNIYKTAYLATEQSLLNPERAMRLTVVDEMISNLEMVQKLVGIILLVIVALVVIFVIRRYIGSRAKVLGILKAQGYKSWQIALSVCLFPLFVSIIGATLGYVVGLTVQFAMFNLFSIFWTIPISTIPFNWLTFVLTLIIPVVALCALTIITTLYFLHRNKPMAMMNGSMEVNESAFARSIYKLNSRTSVKNKFSVSLAMGSIGKLIALFISALFTACITLFFVVSYKAFDKSIDQSYKNKNFEYMVTYKTPTIEGGQIQTLDVKPNGTLDVNNMLYVPVGDTNEGYTYLSNYFKPGYNSTINKNGENGDVQPDDTTTPHIFTKASIDLTVLAGGMSINVWKNLYNAIPESQRASIIDRSQKSGNWLEWTQEGNEYEYNGQKYITKFVNFGTDDEYLSLWDEQNRTYVQKFNNDLGKNENIRISYFKFIESEKSPENSGFKFEQSRDDNSYYESSLVITGKEDSNLVRSQYRRFLVHAYNLMLNYDPNSTNPSHSLLNENERSKMPEYSIDYFITPGATLLGYDDKEQGDDETFTYLDAININNQDIQPQINGYDENSKFIQIKDSSGNNLITKANNFYKDTTISTNIYPLIVNKVVEEKYDINKNDIVELEIKNKNNRLQNKLKENLNENQNMNLNIDSNIYKFKVIGISNTYINEEWITSKEVANNILGLQKNQYNGVISNSTSPVPITNELGVYAYNGYWGAENKIFSTNNPTNLSDSEKLKIINTYRQIFYNVAPNDNSNTNISLMAQNIKLILPNYSNDQINNIIKQLIGIDNLDIQYDSSGSGQAINTANAVIANNAIHKFIDIYGDDALSSSLSNAVANGVEKQYITNASSTINQGLIIVMAIAFVISLTILIMVTSMIINENLRNIAIFGILGYTTREKVMMFFSIYVPIVVVAILLSILLVWLIIPSFLSQILATTSILLPMSLSFVHVLIAAGIIIFVFAITCMIAWMVQGRVKPIMLLKEV